MNSEASSYSFYFHRVFLPSLNHYIYVYNFVLYLSAFILIVFFLLASIHCLFRDSWQIEKKIIFYTLSDCWIIPICQFDRISSQQVEQVEQGILIFLENMFSQVHTSSCSSSFLLCSLPFFCSFVFVVLFFVLSCFFCKSS